MRIPVIRAFVDMNTNEPYNRGAIFESDDTGRITELRNKGFLSPLETVKIPKSQANAPEDNNPSTPSEGDQTETTKPDADKSKAGNPTVAPTSDKPEASPAPEGK